MRGCLICTTPLKKYQKKYCSNVCQLRGQYDGYIKEWKQNKKDGGRGINTRNISNHIKRYLMEKYQEKCVSCGWNQKNLVTGKVPLEIDHINGNSEDNSEANLRLICPNCHALSANFRNLNKGHGRIWRLNKYLKIV